MMSSVLSKDELNMVAYLLGKRCVSPDHTKAYNAIKRDLGSKMDIDEVLQTLCNKGYVGCKKKRPVNYWVDPGKAAKALREAGIPVPIGHVHKL